MDPGCCPRIHATNAQQHVPRRRRRLLDPRLLLSNTDQSSRPKSVAPTGAQNGGWWKWPDFRGMFGVERGWRHGCQHDPAKYIAAAAMSRFF